MTDNLNSDPLDLLARATALQDKAKAAAAEVAKLESEIAELIKIPDSGAVSITFDETGVMTSLVIDAEARAGLDARGLVNEINFAIARSVRPTVAAPPKSSETIEEAAELFNRIFAMASGDDIGEPKTFRNDLGTVTITSVWGTIFSVECSDTWIDAASDGSIAEEVLRVAGEAARADDPMGLRKGTQQ